MAHRIAHFGNSRASCSCVHRHRNEHRLSTRQLLHSLSSSFSATHLANPSMRHLGAMLARNISMAAAVGGGSMSGDDTMRRPPELYKPPKDLAFSVFRITGDGACMFRAVVQGLQFATHGKAMPSNEEGPAALSLRLKVVEELKRRRSEIEPFIPGICDNFEQYLQRMSHPQVWGGEPEMVMASHLLRRPISVYRPISSGVEIIVTYGDMYKSDKIIHLLWSGAHYDLLLPQMAASKL